jgi:O-antigen/teichoic acid export membrane protein
LYGTGALVGGRLIGAALSLVALRLTSTYLGPSRFGAFVTATAVITLVGTLADFGLVTTAARDLAAAETDEQARHVVGVNLALRVTLAFVLVPLTIGLGALMYPSEQQIRVAMLLLAPTLVVTAVQSCAEAIFIGRGRGDLRAVTDVLGKVLLLAGVCVVVWMKLGYRPFLIASGAAAAVAAIGALVLAARLVKPRLVFNATHWRGTLAVALPLGIVQALNVLYFKVDSVLLSLWRTPAEVGQYGVAYKVVELVMAIPSFYMLSLLPALAIADRERTLALVQRAVDFLITLAVPITLGGLLLAPEIVRIVGGDDFGAAAVPLRWLVLAAGASYLSAAFGNALVATGQQRHLVRMSIVVVVVNIAVNVVAIPAGGTPGAAAALFVTEAVALVFVARVFWRRIGGGTSLHQLPKTLVGAALMVGAHLLLSRTSVLIEGPLLLVAFALGVTALRAWPRGGHG